MYPMSFNVLTGSLPLMNVPFGTNPLLSYCSYMDFNIAYPLELLLIFLVYLPFDSLNFSFSFFSTKYIYGQLTIADSGISFKYAKVEPTNVVVTSKLPLDSLNLDENFVICKRYLIALP